MSKSKKKKNELESENLSDFQDVSVTGRTDVPPPAKEEKKQEAKIERVRKPIEVRAAALKGFIFCNYAYDHTVAPNTTNAVTIKSEVPVHDDLKDAFKKLFPHLAVICDEIKAEEIKDILSIDESDPVFEKLKLFNVSAFKLDGYDVKEGVTLMGDKILSIGGAVGLETPKITWDSKYAFVDELRIAISDCLFEVEEYMKGKQADNPQQELPFANEEEQYAEEAL